VNDPGGAASEVEGGACASFVETFCSRLSMGGAPKKALQEFAGHADLTMTQRDMHLSPAAVDAAIGLLERPSGDQSYGDILATVVPPPKRSMNPGG
jgi:hypothetical protein